MMEDPQHMKVDVVTATLLGALLGGLIGMAGSVVGALVELLGPRYLRTRGDIKLRTSRWELEYLPETSSQPAAFHYHLSIHMSNEMEVDTAAQDVQMVLRSQGENEPLENEPLILTPRDAVDGYRIDYVTLPSREVVEKDVRGEIGADILKAHFGIPSAPNRVELKGSWLTGKPFVHTVSANGEVNETQSKYKQWLGPWYRRVF